MKLDTHARAFRRHLQVISPPVNNETSLGSVQLITMRSIPFPADRRSPRYPARLPLCRRQVEEDGSKWPIYYQLLSKTAKAHH